MRLPLLLLLIAPLAGCQLPSLSLFDPATTTPAPAATPPTEPPAASTDPVPLDPAGNLLPAPDDQPSTAITLDALPLQLLDQSARPGPAIPEADVRRTWRIQRHKSLRSHLLEWSSLVSWNLVLETPYDWPVRASASYDGSFLDAANHLASGFTTTRPAPSLMAWTANRILILTDDGSTPY